MTASNESSESGREQIMGYLSSETTREEREINMAFNAGYIKGDDVPEPGACGYLR